MLCFLLDIVQQAWVYACLAAHKLELKSIKESLNPTSCPQKLKKDRCARQHHSLVEHIQSIYRHMGLTCLNKVLALSEITPTRVNYC